MFPRKRTNQQMGGGRYRGESASQRDGYRAQRYCWQLNQRNFFICLNEIKKNLKEYFAHFEIHCTKVSPTPPPPLSQRRHCCSSKLSRQRRNIYWYSPTSYVKIKFLRVFPSPLAIILPLVQPQLTWRYFQFPANCVIGNNTYYHGETFKVDCKTQCVCQVSWVQLLPYFLTRFPPSGMCLNFATYPNT